MSEFNKIKLGKRLTHIEAMVDTDYDHIWDCCCDHGLLGLQLLQHEKSDHIHFVDIVAPLLADIEAKLLRFYQGKKQWSVHCADVALLPIQHYKNDKHLIIIAGVGGELLVELMCKLLLLTGDMHVEYILSPVHHNYQLRQFLRDKSCRLIDESLIDENNRFYEVLHISNKSGSVISPVGNKMWDFDNESHQTYLQKTINHYQRIAKNPSIDISDIIKAYQDVYPLSFKVQNSASCEGADSSQKVEGLTSSINTFNN